MTMGFTEILQHSKYRRTLLLTLVLFFCLWVFGTRFFPSAGVYRPAIVSLTVSSELLSEACLLNKSFGRSIHQVYDTIQHLKLSRVPECQEILKIFNNIVSLDEVEGKILLPDEFVSQVKEWLGNDEDSFQQIYRQVISIYKVVSRLSSEETVFNLLRSKRPVSKSGIDPYTYIDELINSSSLSCDFCRYRQHTAADEFGRIESQFSATASNTFKLAKFHGLFFPLGHHPLNINYTVLLDLFVKTSREWFQAAYKLDPTQIYPSLLWDSLPHAGASQVHPHVHGMLDDKQYAGAFEELHQSSKKYFQDHSRYLWPDFIMVHKVLGLTVEQGTAVAIVPITARKDHEFWIIAPEMNEDVVKLIHRILEAYRTSLNTFCHSAGAVYPLLGTSPTSNRVQNGLPLIMRIGSRGDCTSLRSDVSSLELYTVNNINSDLAITIAALEKTSSHLF